MLNLIDLIQLSGVTLGHFKIHCATGKRKPPLEAFFGGTFKEWQEHQHQTNFECDEVVSLIHLGGDRWLFAGVWKVLGYKPRGRGKERWYEYSTREIGGLDHLTGKAIVQFGKKFRASYLIGRKYADGLAVVELRDQRMSVADFPGYNSVLLSFRLLQTIIRQNLPSWRSPLNSVSGVYVITDIHNGRQYVGSAYGGEGIWQRWELYARNGHGGNKELRDVLKDEREGYRENFQFSILEVCDLNASFEYVISRETHWKTVLRSREFGYNSN